MEEGSYNVKCYQSEVLSKIAVMVQHTERDYRRVIPQTVVLPQTCV